MLTQTKFKLKDSKPDNDFVEWNRLMSKNWNQDEYYKDSHPFIVWTEKKRLEVISYSIKRHLETTNLVDPTIVEVGCGYGYVMKEVASKIKTKNLIGVDILEDWLEIAREK